MPSKTADMAVQPSMETWTVAFSYSTSVPECHRNFGFSVVETPDCLSSFCWAI